MNQLNVFVTALFAFYAIPTACYRQAINYVLQGLYARTTIPENKIGTLLTEYLAVIDDIVIPNIIDYRTGNLLRNEIETMTSNLIKHHSPKFAKRAVAELVQRLNDHKQKLTQLRTLHNLSQHRDLHPGTSVWNGYHVVPRLHFHHVDDRQFHIRDPELRIDMLNIEKMMDEWYRIQTDIHYDEYDDSDDLDNVYNNRLNDAIADINRRIMNNVNTTTNKYKINYVGRQTETTDDDDAYDYFDADDIFTELNYYANQHEHDHDFYPDVTLVAPIAPKRPGLPAFSNQLKMESLYDKAPPRQPLWKYSAHRELINEHVFPDRCVYYAIFLKRLEVIVYPGANQTDLYELVFKMLKFNGDLYLAKKK